MSSPTFTAVVLAAGESTRFTAPVTKMLQPVAGKALIKRVLDTLKDLPIAPVPVVVVGKQAAEVVSFIGHGYSYAYQVVRMGSGHALACARESLEKKTDNLLVIHGDIPLLTVETLQRMMLHHLSTGAAFTLGVSQPAKLKGYGRVLRDPITDVPERVIEERDLAILDRHLVEVNAGVYCCKTMDVMHALSVSLGGSKSEVHVTDVIPVLRHWGHLVSSFLIPEHEIQQVNDLSDLENVERMLREKETVRV